MYSLPVTSGGLSIANPIDTANAQFDASQQATSMLSSLLLAASDMECADHQAHRSHFAAEAQKAKRRRQQVHEQLRDALAGEKVGLGGGGGEAANGRQKGRARAPAAVAAANAPHTARAPLAAAAAASRPAMPAAAGQAQPTAPRAAPLLTDPHKRRAFIRAASYKTGAFLLVPPVKSVGFHLAKYQWLDAIAVRYNLTLKNAPAFCSSDRCRARNGPNGSRYTLKHALVCKFGGNVIQRHNAVQNAFKMLCEEAYGKAAVKANPWLNKKGDRDALDHNNVCEEGRCGDLLVDGLHRHATTMIDFTVGVQAAEDTQIVLEKMQNTKIEKYQQICEVRGYKCAPYAITPDGAHGAVAWGLLNSVASSLREKWGKPKCTVTFWARARMSCAIARATSDCIRRSRGDTRGLCAWDKTDVGFEDGAATMAPP